MRVLGVDPGLTRCGIGVIDGAPGKTLTLVATGVIKTDAGDDIAGRPLALQAGIEYWLPACHTEICPMNSLVQRAGRCARFENQAGLVHVYDAPNPFPYCKEEIDATRRLLPDCRVMLTPAVTELWVEEAHRVPDEKEVRKGWAARQIECSDRSE